MTAKVVHLRFKVSRYEVSLGNEKNDNVRATDSKIVSQLKLLLNCPRCYISEILLKL